MGYNSLLNNVYWSCWSLNLPESRSEQLMLTVMFSLDTVDVLVINGLIIKSWF